MTSPPPARVPGNLWTAIAAPAMGALDASATVSVLVEGDDPEGFLPLTLAALSEQTYPRSLMEVVVDVRTAAEEEACRDAAGGMALRLSRPVAGAGGEDAGDSAEPATGEILLFVAAGSLPTRDLVAAHARWHHAASDVASVGRSGAIHVGGLTASGVREAQRGGALGTLLESRRRRDRSEAALEAYLDMTHDLTERRIDAFWVAARGSLGVRSATYRDAGGRRLGLERGLARIDLAYRLETFGCVFVPERRARSFHAYPEPDMAPRRVADGPRVPTPAGPADPRVAALIPTPGFRHGYARRLARPAMVVDLPVGSEPAEVGLEAVDAVLRGRFGDLELRLQVPEAHPERTALEEACGRDPRILLGPGVAGRPVEAPYRVTLPVVAVPDERTLGDIHELMSVEGVGLLHVTVPGELPRRAMIRAVATGPLARAERVAAAGGGPVDTVLAGLFGERWVSGVEVSVRRRGAAEPEVTAHGPLGPATDLAHEHGQAATYRSRAARGEAAARRYARRAERELLRARAWRARAERLRKELEGGGR